MNDVYESPFTKRYASKSMCALFSEQKRVTTWRQLWVALAAAQKELGLNIPEQAITEMKAHITDINFEVAHQKEKEVRHDVMAHIHAFAEQCPTAKPIIHLGATSCYVGDNTDLLLMKEALGIVQRKLVAVMKNLAHFARTYKELPTLGFTHFQPAQLVTVGKRACMWLQDLWLDYHDIEDLIQSFRFLGVKGTTGTGASFLKLFDGDAQKVAKLDALVAQKMGFEEVWPISGQTYTRKFDTKVLNVLSAIAQGAHKFATDMRLLQSLKEMEEPFEKHQVGSSAMAYKRNPMRCERMCSLARGVMIQTLNPAMTAANQWFERTLDDSANKRMVIPEAFLGVDSLLELYNNVTSGLVVYPKVIERHIAEELPFMATENILMHLVKKGGDRQVLHEAIREHAMEAGMFMKQEGGACDLIERLQKDHRFQAMEGEWERVLDPVNFIGISALQVDSFLNNTIQPILDKFHGEAGFSELQV